MTTTHTAEWMEAEVERLRGQVDDLRGAAAAFYFVMDCENCGEEIYHGLNLTTLEYRGHPAIPFDMASQTNFQCDDCGASNYTGDFSEVVFTEDGEADDEGGGE